jgi:glycosyltransferase involved in cell wall biosynthesis
MKLLTVSIVVAAYNEEKDIKNLLDSLMALDYPKKKLEIIVVDDGSTDKTPQIISKYPVKIIKGPHKGVGVARNLGWKAAKNDIIMFFDADMIVDKKYIREVMKYYQNHSVVPAGGITFSRNADKFIARMLYLRNVLGIKENDFVFAAICPKKILKEVGGFDPSYGYYDDWELAMKIKKRCKIHRIAKAKIWHNDPETLNELWRQCKWAGKSMIFSFKGYVIHGIRRVLFPLLCAPMPLYILFSFLQFPFNFLGITGLFLFLIIEIRRSIKMYHITKWKESFLTPLFDFFSMALVMIGMILGLTSKNTPKA